MAVHGKNTRVLIDQYDMTRIFNEASRTGAKDEADTTTFGTDDRDYEAGFHNNAVSFNGNYDTQRVFETGPPIKTADDILSALFDDDSASLVLSLGHGGLAFGKRILLFKGTTGSYETTSPVADKVSIAAGMSGRERSLNGYSLHDLVAVTAAGNGATFDSGAGSASLNGAIGHLHVTANTRGAGSNFKIQHSADGTTWVDLILFTAVVAATKAKQRVTAAGTVERYLRAVWTPGGATGSITFFAAFARL